MDVECGIMNMDATLQSRIVNCLQTILELEQQLSAIDLGRQLVSEFGVLKSFLSRIESVQLVEDDVLRIERATESFLDELRIPLSMADVETPSENRLMH